MTRIAQRTHDQKDPETEVGMVAHWVWPPPAWVVEDMLEITMIAESLNEAVTELTATRERAAIKRIEQLRDKLNAWCINTRAEEWTQ